MLWHKLPKSIYFRRGSPPIALDEVITDGHKRALIVTDRFLFNNGYADQITSVLKAAGVETEVFFEVEADPTLTIVRKGADTANSFKPDVIIAPGRRFPDGCGENHVGHVRTSGNPLRRTGAALYGYP